MSLCLTSLTYNPHSKPRPEKWCQEQMLIFFHESRQYHTEYTKRIEARQLQKQGSDLTKVRGHTWATWGQSFPLPLSGPNYITHALMDIGNYNPPNNFCGLSLDKTNHVMQNRTMVIRGYPPSDLISVVWFYFDGRKTKKQANVQAKLLTGQEKPKKTFCRSQGRINKKLVDNFVPRNTKKSTKYAGTI